jgi:hypothetical protein
VENHGDLPCNGDLRFLYADSLRELHSPGLKGGPFLRPIKQNGRRFEQVASEKPVAPSRYRATGVSFARLVAPRGKAQITWPTGGLRRRTCSAARRYAHGSTRAARSRRGVDDPRPTAR